MKLPPDADGVRNSNFRADPAPRTGYHFTVGSGFRVFVSVAFRSCSHFSPGGCKKQYWRPYQGFGQFGSAHFSPGGCKTAFREGGGGARKETKLLQGHAKGSRGSFQILSRDPSFQEALNTPRKTAGVRKERWLKRMEGSERSGPGAFSTRGSRKTTHPQAAERGHLRAQLLLAEMRPGARQSDCPTVQLSWFPAIRFLSRLSCLVFSGSFH